MDLPYELFPERDDESRLSQLFSIDSYDNNTNIFWKKTISSYCIYNKTLSFLPSELTSAFIIHDIIPTSINKSINELVLKKDILLKQDILDSIHVKSVISIASSWLYSTLISTSDTSNQHHVCVSILETIEKIIIESINKITNESGDKNRNCFYIINNDNNDVTYNNIITTNYSDNILFSAYLKSIPNILENNLDKYIASFLINLNDDDINLIISYLVNKRAAILSDDQTFLKIIFHSNDNKITEKDIAILNLKKSITQLERKINELYISIKSHESKALIHKNRGETKLALLQLHAKKNKVAIKDKYSISLVQLEQAFMQIEDTEFNIIITNAYQNATNGMKSIRETANLTVETIDDALDAFNDEMDILKDINAALSQSNNEDFGEDIELEFASLSIGQQNVENSINVPPSPINSMIHTPTKLKNTSSNISTANLPLPPIIIPMRENNNINSNKEKDKDPILI